MSPRLESLNQKRLTRVLLSCLAHAVVLALAVLLGYVGRARPVDHDSRCCTTPLYWTGNTAPSASHLQQSVHRRRIRHKHAPVPPEPVISSETPATQTASAQPAAALGTGNGQQNAEPALPAFFPKPAVPNRALLPAATQNVIVEVNVSALGQVTGERLVQGLGNPIDQVVLDTVKGWRFHPATLNGTAIASIEDLVFPFGRDVPTGQG